MNKIFQCMTALHTANSPWPTKITVGLASCALFGTLGQVTTAAELLPYQLPQQSQRMNQQSPQSPPQISDAYYDSFEHKTKGLTPAQKTDLVRDFEKKRDDAIVSKRADAVLHYARLLQILREAK
jgi:hypothetical protein